MAEENKIEDSLQDGKSESAEENTSSANAVIQPQTNNNKQQTEEMEVHHHTHAHGKKNWKTHLWEFLMLFLAVFCGFLAEYQLEHTIEHQREKEFMITMLEDLRDDTAYLHQMTKEWDNVNRSLDSVIAALEAGSTTENRIKAYRHLNNAFNFWGFANHDRTISQLKYSGGFRLIRNKTVANKIISYDQFNVNALRKIGEQYNFFYETAVTLRNKVFAQAITYAIFKKYRYDQPPLSDEKWIESMINSKPVPVTKEIYAAQLFEFKNALYSYRKDFSNMAFGYWKTEDMAAELITLIKENYHLN